MPLIIRDQLLTPPTWFLSFRDLTLYCVTFMRAEIVIEIDSGANPDSYWKWMKPRGGMDYVKDFVERGKEDGVRLDTEPNFPRTIVTDRIAIENYHRLLGQIKFLGGLS